MSGPSKRLDDRRGRRPLALGLAVALSLFAAAAAATPPAKSPRAAASAAEAPRIAVVAVEASSTLPAEGDRRFDAAHLVDGDPQTEWRPHARGAFGIGQWVRLDLGAVHEVTRIEVLVGSHHKGEGSEGFCAVGRPRLVGYGDDAGRIGFDPSTAGGKGVAGERVFVSDAAHARTKPRRTRTLTLRVDGVERGYGSADVAISEVRVFGAPATAATPERGDVACNSARYAQLRAAVIAECARRYRDTRPLAECTSFVGRLAACGGASWLPIEEDAWERGEVAVEDFDDFQTFPPTYTLALRRDGARWQVTRLACTYDRDAPGEACGLSRTLDSDVPDHEDPELTWPARCRELAGREHTAPGKTW